MLVDEFPQKTFRVFFLFRKETFQGTKVLFQTARIGVTLQQMAQEYAAWYWSFKNS